MLIARAPALQIPSLISSLSSSTFFITHIPFVFLPQVSPLPIQYCGHLGYVIVQQMVTKAISVPLS
jgi:hypothetical protein